MISTTPPSPISAPRTRRRVIPRRRTRTEIRITKIGAVELSTPASPLSTWRWPQASRVHAPKLLKKACIDSIAQEAPSRGRRCPPSRAISNNTIAATETLMATSVTGPIVSTATAISR